MLTEINLPSLIKLESQEECTFDPEIKNDYFDHLRLNRISDTTWEVLRQLLRPYYQWRAEDPEQTKQACFAEGTLAQVAEGELSGIVLPENLRSWQTLSHTLLRGQNNIKFGAIICPDYSWYTQGDTVVYEMGQLNGGLPKTAEKVGEYLETLASRARRFDQSVSFTAYLPAWELTRDEYLPKINGGITSKEALGLLDSSATKLKEYLFGLDNERFRTNVEVLKPEAFHPQAQAETAKLVRDNPKIVEGILRARQGFYGRESCIEEVARDLAEARLGFNYIQPNCDILLVPTSPAIARACLAKGSTAWIQLTHGYKG
jgi:hypothetical protein